MDNNDMDFLDRELNKEIPLPAGLSPSAIEELISSENSAVKTAEEGEEQVQKNLVRDRRRNRHIVRRILAAAACLVLLVFGAETAYVYGGNALRSARVKRIAEKKLETVQDSPAAQAVLNNYCESYIKATKKDMLTLSDFGYLGRAKYAAQEDYAFYGAMADGVAADNAAMATGSVNESSAESSGSVQVTHSETNLQVAGVDEGDIVKNDGRYLYIFSDKINIVDTADPASMKIASTIDLPERSADSEELYIYGDKLIAVYSAPVDRTDDAESYSAPDSVDYARDSVYCPTFDLEYVTVVRVFDISDKTRPAETHSECFSGRCVSSRLYGGRLLTVTDYDIYYYSYGVDFEEQCDRLLSICVPYVSVDGGEFVKLTDDRIRVSDKDNGFSYTVIAVSDLTGKIEPSVRAELGSSGDIFVTGDHLYLLSYDYDEDSGEGTLIRKYDVSGADPEFLAETKARGSMLDRFSADEYEGNFRIALTVWDYDGKGYSAPDHYSTVTVFDKDLKQIGMVKDIGRDEDIYAVRFMGDTAYVVTFRNTDPLFIIDLSDPAEPVVTGEVKLPGFSEYLHPFGGDLLVGVGVKDGGNGGKLVLFDVSDPAAPRVLSDYVSHRHFVSDSRAFTVIDENTFAVVQENSYGIPRSVLVMKIENGELVKTGQFDSAVELRSETYDYAVADEFDDEFDDDPDYSEEVWEDSYYTSYYMGYSYENMRAAFTGSTIFAAATNGVTAYDISDDSAPIGVLELERK